MCLAIFILFSITHASDDFVVDGGGNSSFVSVAMAVEEILFPFQW